MKKPTFILFFLLVLAANFLPAQEEAERKWQVYAIGGGWMDGMVQYFDGYTEKIFNANVRSGVPRRADWDYFGNSAYRPSYAQAGLYMHFLHTKKNYRGRVTLSWAQRADTMHYQSMFTTADTLYGRAAIEKVGFLSLGLTAMKTSKLLWKFLRIYGGIEVEFAFSSTSKIRYWEYKYNFDSMKFEDYGQYEGKGKPRLDLYASALVGLEICFLKRMGITIEGKSGFGGHFILAESPAGISKTGYMLGLNYYFKGY